MPRRTILPDSIRRVLLRYQRTECFILLYLLGTAKNCGFKLSRVNVGTPTSLKQLSIATEHLEGLAHHTTDSMPSLLVPRFFIEALQAVIRDREEVGEWYLSNTLEDDVSRQAQNRSHANRISALKQVTFTNITVDIFEKRQGLFWARHDETGVFEQVFV